MSGDIDVSDRVQGDGGAQLVPHGPGAGPSARRQITLARRRKRWTEAELATRVRLSRSTVVKIERGTGTVALNAILEVC